MCTRLPVLTIKKDSTVLRSIDPEVAPLLNSFDPNDRESFYQEIEEQIKAMRKDGAEFIIVYPHWGIEYQMTEASWQREIAQSCVIWASMLSSVVIRT